MQEMWGFASFRCYQERLLSQCKGVPATSTARKELDLFAKDELPSYLAGHTSEEPVTPVFPVQLDVNVARVPDAAPVLLGRISQCHVPALLEAAKPAAENLPETPCDSDLDLGIDGDHLQFPDVVIDNLSGLLEAPPCPSPSLASSLPPRAQRDGGQNGCAGAKPGLFDEDADIVSQEDDPFDMLDVSDEEPQEIIYRGPLRRGLKTSTCVHEPSCLLCPSPSRLC